MPRFTPSINKILINDITKNLSHVQLNKSNNIRSLATLTEEQVAPTIPNTAPDLEDLGKPIKLNAKILKFTESSIAKDEPHFKIGGKKLYLPTARIILLRSNAKHTPYQAKFIVPKSFNKLDLRDYLYHVYGLRAFNITTQLLNARYVRSNVVSPRYRGPQIKKMTIEMDKPFIWPEEPVKNDPWLDYVSKELSKYREEASVRIGSDEYKPGKSFESVVGPYEPIAQPFVPKFLQRTFLNEKKKAEKLAIESENLNKIEKLVSQQKI
ncbi:related to 54S ribosomal protein L41, mitochondrial [Saccharomycodes ludwigii]|uniref:Large ribosomal subunit protein uL23m n=1 Tax=Saccharomycodes ludwigii TaxID=36035 RepID=A0A376B5Z8_9ASCO|nr:hypothetical protein SCDLUD_003276 [Saccharomycodes ludwigii]KAH3900304.1 hypothetical protein SCDLUD_003276 [Saccharomycodes ludwigii]SSD60127.1 related to 54S ribosomal protein L41, mitochondrial [Saccharomycodes ludwigii]